MGRAEGMTRRNSIGNFNGLELGRWFGNNHTVFQGVNRNNFLVFIIVTFIDLALVVQKLDSAIYRINLYPLDNAISFRNIYPLGGDFPVDSDIHRLNNWGPVKKSNSMNSKRTKE